MQQQMQQKGQFEQKLQHLEQQMNRMKTQIDEVEQQQMQRKEQFKQKHQHLDQQVDQLKEQMEHLRMQQAFEDLPQRPEQKQLKEEEQRLLYEWKQLQKQMMYLLSEKEQMEKQHVEQWKQLIITEKKHVEQWRVVMEQRDKDKKADDAHDRGDQVADDAPAMVDVSHLSDIRLKRQK